MRHLFLLLLVVLHFSCRQANPQNVVASDAMPSYKKSILIDSYKYNSADNPIISVHRGGKSIPNYPENCIETLKYINDSIVAIYEIDIAQTKDNVLVLLHDKSLDRTTTGTGLLKDWNYDDIQELYLKDDFGNITDFKIPLLKDVLNWATSNNVVLTLDIKRGVQVENVVEQIKNHKAQDNTIIITYDLKQAQKAFKAAPELLLSVSARNEKELEWLIHSSILTENMLAFTGTRLSDPELYSKIHAYGIKTILGTLGNLDQQAESKGDKLYRQWIQHGIDVIATDRPFQVAKVLELIK